MVSASVQPDVDGSGRAQRTQQRMKHRATLLEACTADAVVDQVQAAVGDDSAIDELQVASFPMELENTRFVMIELGRLQDGARDKVRILELVLGSKLAEVALLQLPDVEGSAGGIDWVAEPVPRRHKLRELARTNDFFHLNDFQDALIRAIPDIRNGNFHFVLSFHLLPPARLLGKRTPIAWMDWQIIPHVFGGLRTAFSVLNSSPQRFRAIRTRRECRVFSGPVCIR